MTTLSNGSTYTTAAEIIDSEYISRRVLEALREELTAPNFCTVVDIGAMSTRQVAFPKNNTFSASTKGTDDTLTASTAYNPTEATAAVVEYDVAAIVTDMLAKSSVVDVAEQVAIELTGALATQMQTSFTAMAAGYNGGSQKVGSTGVNLTADNMLEAMKNLRANAKSKAGIKPAFILHPQQGYDMSAEGLSASLGLGTAFSRDDIVSVYGANANLLHQFAGTFSGVPIFLDSTCATANSAADRNGMLICQDAIGLAVKWMPQVEAQRNISNMSNSTVYLGTVAYVFCEIDDLRGVLVQTGA